MPDCGAAVAGASDSASARATKTAIGVTNRTSRIVPRRHASAGRDRGPEGPRYVPRSHFFSARLPWHARIIDTRLDVVGACRRLLRRDVAVAPRVVDRSLWR